MTAVSNAINYQTWPRLAVSMGYDDQGPITGDVFTKLQLASIQDVNPTGSYDTINYRWTPGVRGWYQVSGNILFKQGTYTSVSSYVDASIYKNGAELYRVELAVPAANPTTFANGPGATVSALVYLDDNDYIELWTRTGNISGTQTLYGSNGVDGAMNWMTAYLAIPQA